MQENPIVAPKPKWFTPITVSAMVLGSLFACCGATSVGGQVLNRSAPNAVLRLSLQHTPNKQSAAATQRYVERNLAIQARLFPYAVTAGVVAILHGLALLGAGFMAYKVRASGRALLIVVCLIGIGVDLMSSSLGLYVADETSANTTELMKAQMTVYQPKTATDSERARETQERVVQVAAQVTRVLGLMTLIGIFSFKVAYYLGCVFYLRRSAVIEFFERTAGTEPSAT